MSKARLYPRATSSKRGYGARWQKARRAFLDLNPLCCMCAEEKRITAATVVDHIKPHKGDEHLFWNVNNWQALCKHCHDRHKQRQEHGGLTPVINADGWPQGFS